MNKKILEEIKDELRKNIVESVMLMRKTYGMEEKDIADLIYDLLDKQAMEMYKLVVKEQDEKSK